ncbi:hypothetical protein AB4Z39_05215 [Mycobacterium adipatum]|uniref:hypothetical protein n=1 Tax=Mycobacterium adipatum TaxID=1682113 RepID=UPI0034E0A65A
MSAEVDWDGQGDPFDAWREGLVSPRAITAALDVRALYGPEVDEACGVQEPAVDQWEAGQLYPSWEQLEALSRLTGFPVQFFTRAHDSEITGGFLCQRSGRGRGCRPLSTPRGPQEFPPDVVAATVGTHWHNPDKKRGTPQ